MDLNPALKQIQDTTGKAYKFYDMIKTRLNAYQVLLNSLKQTNQHEIIELLLYNKFPNELRIQKVIREKIGESKKPTLFEVNSPNEHFVGRDEELDLMISKINDNSNKQQPLLILGESGIGKTQVCRMFAERHQNDFQDTIWINGQTEGSLASSFSRLARDCLQIPERNINGEEKDIYQTVKDVYKYLSKRKSLYIFDNVVWGSHLNKFLPNNVDDFQRNKTFPTSPAVILTSCSEPDSIILSSNLIIRLGVLKEPDAIELACKILPNVQSENTEVTRLVKCLKLFPLAIRLATAYLREQQCSNNEFTITQYVSEFDRIHNQVMDHPGWRKETNDFLLTTLTTWIITTTAIGQPLVQSFFKSPAQPSTMIPISSENELIQNAVIQSLECIAFIDPYPINPFTFDRWISYESIIDNLLKAFSLLIRYNILEATNDTNYSIHPLVQMSIRKHLTFGHCDKPVLSNILKILAERVTRKDYGHLMTAWKHCSEDLREEFSYIPSRITADMLANKEQAGNRQLDKLSFETLLGDHYVSRSLLWSAYYISYDSLEVKCELGLLNICQGNYLKALDLFCEVKKCVEIETVEDKLLDYRAHLGAAACLRDLGKFEKAITCFKKAGERHPQAAILTRAINYSKMILSRGNSGLGWFLASSNNKLIKWHNELCSMGNQENVIQYTTSKLACFLMIDGKLSEAKKILQENLERDINQGESDNSLYMARILRMEGKYIEALMAHQDIYRQRALLYGETDLYTIIAKYDIGIDMCFLMRNGENFESFDTVYGLLLGLCSLLDIHLWELQCKRWIESAYIEMHKSEQKFDLNCRMGICVRKASEFLYELQLFHNILILNLQASKDHSLSSMMHLETAKCLFGLRRTHEGIIYCVKAKYGDPASSEEIVHNDDDYNDAAAEREDDTSKPLVERLKPTPYSNNPQLKHTLFLSVVALILSGMIIFVVHFIIVGGNDSNSRGKTNAITNTTTKLQTFYKRFETESISKNILRTQAIEPLTLSNYTLTNDGNGNVSNNTSVFRSISASSYEDYKRQIGEIQDGEQATVTLIIRNVTVDWINISSFLEQNISELHVILEVCDDCGQGLIGTSLITELVQHSRFAMLKIRKSDGPECSSVSSPAQNHFYQQNVDSRIPHEIPIILPKLILEYGGNKDNLVSSTMQQLAFFKCKTFIYKEGLIDDDSCNHLTSILSNSADTLNSISFVKTYWNSTCFTEEKLTFHSVKYLRLDIMSSMQQRSEHILSILRAFPNIEVFNSNFGFIPGNEIINFRLSDALKTFSANILVQSEENVLDVEMFLDTMHEIETLNINVLFEGKQEGHKCVMKGYLLAEKSLNRLSVSSNCLYKKE